MSEESKNNPQEYDPLTEAISYGTIWTNSLFQDDRSTIKITRAGGIIDSRVRVAPLIWGAVFVFIFFLFSLGIFALFNLDGVMVIPFGAAALFVGLGGWKLGNWSPMQKSTGEDLTTYIGFVLRRKISSGGFGSGPISTTELLSKAVGGEEGRVVKCTQWVGSQPLRNAPLMNPYVREYSAPRDIPPRGEYAVVDSQHYNDGLGDRG